MYMHTAWLEKEKPMNYSRWRAALFSFVGGADERASEVFANQSRKNNQIKSHRKKKKEKERKKERKKGGKRKNRFSCGLFRIADGFLMDFNVRQLSGRWRLEPRNSGIPGRHFRTHLGPKMNNPTSQILQVSLWYNIITQPLLLPPILSPNLSSIPGLFEPLEECLVVVIQLITIWLCFVGLLHRGSVLINLIAAAIGDSSASMKTPWRLLFSFLSLSSWGWWHQPQPPSQSSILPWLSHYLLFIITKNAGRRPIIIHHGCSVMPITNFDYFIYIYIYIYYF